jgi:coenzyme PQQ precursor peptide PqqA
MTPQNQQPSQVKNQKTKMDASASRLPIRNSHDWEKPDFQELDLCMEITAYVYHCQ